MAPDPQSIHPDLRRIANKIPRSDFNQKSVGLVRFLASLQPAPKIPGDIRVEKRFIRRQDGQKDIRLRIYRPKASLAPVPALVWIHGGGYVSGRPEMGDMFLMPFSQELGIVVVSVDYRLAPEHPFPAPLEDCYSALAWVHEQAQSLGIDPERIAIGGESAGGGLAAALAQLAFDRGEVRPVFQMLAYPMVDDRTVLRPDPPQAALMTWSPASNRFGWEAYLHQKGGAEALPPYAAAARRADLAGLPPAWIGVGTLDLFYAEDLAYADQLKKAGVECELVVVPGAFHGFDFFDQKISVVRDFRQSQIRALRKYLLPE